MFKKLSIVGLVAVLAVMFFVLPGLAQEKEEAVIIYFFPGGNPGGVYAARVYNGAALAAEILGDRVEMHYLWSDWNPQKMVSQFQEALAANPDGIAIMGHPGDEALKPFVDEAVAKGIVVTTMDTTLPQLEEEYKTQGFGFVGEEQYAAGYKLAAEAVRVAKLGEGNKAVVYGILREPTRGQATRGAIDALEEAGVTVDHIEISQAANSDPTQAIPIISGYLQKNPDIDLFLTDHSNMTSSLPVILDAAGVSPDDFFVAGMGLSVAQLDGIRSGYLDIVMDKQPFVQGFLAVYQIYLSKLFGFSGFHIPTGAGFITIDNVDEITSLVEQGYH
ncbi:MAG: substrate-binding domain-containing protein [Dehalococcoidia bacterium]|nr:substrate-binding domain-containing protein [Dehalococcoidia bacterium]